MALGWRGYLVLAEGVSSIRTYYASDTRIDSILFGCILALSLLIFSLIYREEVFRETLRYTLQGIALMPIFYYAIKNNKNPLFDWLNHSLIKKTRSLFLCYLPFS